jgi:hypothetical protein
MGSDPIFPLPLPAYTAPACKHGILTFRPGLERWVLRDPSKAPESLTISRYMVYFMRRCHTWEV